MIAERDLGGSGIDKMLWESTEEVRARESSALDDLLRANKNNVVLFGAGSAGKRAVSCLRSIGVEPLAVADSDPRRANSMLDGIRVESADHAATAFGSDALFIVTIWNAQHSFAETKQRLADLGVRSIASLSALQWRFPKDFLPFFSLDLPHRLYEERDDVVRAESIWADERSRAEYAAHIRWRALGEFEAIPKRAKEKQYFPDFFRLSSSESFLDCGAFDGDTLREFLKRSEGKFDHLLAVEPSPETHFALKSWIEQLPASQQARIEAKCCAVGERCATLRFDARDGRDARLSDDGEYAVDCITLDALCAATRTTYIKMDIEGAEAAALVGARGTITRDKPILAICLYHRQTDLWRLPLFVRDLVPEYRMYLRSHEHDGWETVAYAVPPGRAI